MELSTLVFKTETSDLERASKAIEQLVKDFSKVSVSAQQAAKLEAQTNEIISRTLMNEAKARKESAVAIDKQIKTKIAADNADKKLEEQTKKSTAVVEKSVEVEKKRHSVLEKTETLYKYMLEGMSTGQAKTMAQAEAAGHAASELDKLRGVLLKIRDIQGGAPFDNSNAGLVKMQQEVRELSEAMRQYDAQSGLTAKQTRELARDKLRLSESMKASGATTQEVDKALSKLNSEYVALAKQVNTAADAEKAVIKARKDAASATEYLTQQDQKMAAALNISNAAVDKSGSDLLVKYEQSLRKAGVAQDVASQKLATYKQQLIQVQVQEEKRKERNLARALSPQISDVAVSLYSGQAPLTVLMQQGFQILDLFTLSGVKAEEFGATMKRAFESMLPAMWTVVKGVGSFVVGSLYDAGKAATNFVGNMLGINPVINKTIEGLQGMGVGGQVAAKGLQILGVTANTLAAGGVLALIGAVVGLAIGFKQFVAENNELARSLAISGASMGVSMQGAIDYAKSMNVAGVSTTNAVKVITEMAKTSKFVAEEIPMVTKAAVDMQTYGGVAIEETVKQFAKMKEKPVESLIELAKTTGNVSPAVIRLVNDLVQQGEVAKAAAVGMDALAKSNKDATDAMKRDLNSFSLALIKIWENIKNFTSSAIKAVFYNDTTEEAYSKVLEQIDRNLKRAREQASHGTFGSSQDQVKMLEAQRQQILNALEFTKASREQQTQQKQFNSEAASAEEARIKLIKQAEDATEKAEMKTMSLAKFRETFVRNKLQDAAAEKGAKIELLQKDKELLAVLEKQADAEYKRMHKSDAGKAAREREKEIDVLNKLNDLTASYNNDLQRLQNLRERGVLTEAEYVRYVEELIAKQPFAVKFQKEINEAHELENKLLGTSERLGKDYYKTREYILATYKDEVTQKKLLEILDANTPVAKERIKLQEKRLEIERQINEELRQRAEANNLADLKLDMRVELLGKTSEQQKYIRIEQERQLKILDAQFQLEKKIEQLRLKKDKKDSGYTEEDFARDVERYEKDYAEKVRLINKETAVIYAEDLDREIANIRSGITDSIVTALFEGGKAGGKKLRDLLVGTLRKKVTMVVDVVVNTLLGNVVGSFAQMLGFGGGGGGGGGILGLASNASSIYNAGSSLMGGGFGSFLGGGSFVGMMSNIGAGIAHGFTTLFSEGLGAVFAQGTGLIGAGATGGGLGTLLGGIGLPALGIGIIANALGLFRKTKKVDGGLSGTLGEEGGVHEFSLMRKSGTLFSGPKYWVDDEGVAEQDKVLQDAFKTMKTNVIEMGKVLGLDTSKLDNFKTRFGTDLIHPDTKGYGIKFKDLSQQEIEAKIAEALATANNEIAQQIIGKWEERTVTAEEAGKRLQGGSLKDALRPGAGKAFTETVYIASEYAREGEKAIDTLTRLATSITAVNATFDMLNLTLLDASLAGGDLASRFLDLFGGVEKFNAAANSYYQNFFTADERRDKARKQIDEKMKEFGLGPINYDDPDARKQYRALVEKEQARMLEEDKRIKELMQSFTNAGSSGLEYYDLKGGGIMGMIQGVLGSSIKDEGTLSKIRDSFVGFARGAMSAEKLNEEISELIKGSNEAGKSGTETTAMLLQLAGAFAEVTTSAEDAENQAKQRAEEEKQKREKAIDDALRALENAINKEKALLNERANTIKQTISTLKSLFDFLSKAVKDLYLLGDATAQKTYAEARAYIAKDYQSVIKGGSISDPALLQENVTTAMQGLKTSDFATRQDYDRERLRLAAQLAVLRDSTKKSLTTEELILEQVEKQIKRLDETLDYWKQQVGLSKGIIESTLSVSEAIKNLSKMLFPDKKEDNGPSVKPPYSGVQDSNWTGKKPWSFGQGYLETPEKFQEEINYGFGGRFGLQIQDPERNKFLRGLREMLQLEYGNGTPEDLARIAEKAKAMGATQADISSALGFWKNDIVEIFKSAGIPAFASGGSYRGGVALVGEEGPELINFSNSGTVHTARQTKELLEGSTAGRIEALEQSNRQIFVVLKSIESNTKRSADVLRNVTPRGDSVSITQED